jgi:hypothetical protein
VRIRQPAVFVAIGLALSLALAGCAPTQYDSATANELQSDVLGVSRAAADGDWAGASAGLDRVVTAAQQAAAAGRIGPDRLQSILAAVADVRADLQHEIAVSPSPEPTHHGKGPKH